jgi:hypothetical protein
MAISRIKGGQILRDVRIAMELNPKTTPLTDVGDVGTLALNDIITSKILDGIIAVESVAPIRLLDSSESLTGYTINWASDLEYSGYVILPENFMRLISFKMSDWLRPVTQAINETDDLYLAQRADVKGVRGNYQKPVCAIVQSNYGPILEFYSCKSQTASIQSAVVRNYPTIDSEGGVDISAKCYQAVIYYIAGLVFSTYNDTERANTMYQLSKAELENVK